MNYFEVFGLERRLAIDAAELQRRFYELAKESHPDRHYGAPPAEQARVLEASALVNAAYRTLRDPIARIEYLVRLEEGWEAREGGTAPKAPPELLEEMFEIQEELQQANLRGVGPSTRAVLTDRRDRLQERYRAEEARLRGPLSEAWDAADAAGRRAAIAAAKDSLATRAYLRTVVDDLEAGLGEGQEGNVTHRRH